MFLSAGLESAAESTSATKKSLYSLQTHSGYSADMKFIITLNDWAFVGTRMRSVSMIGSLALVLVGGRHPPGLGSSPPLASSQSDGTGLAVPRFTPGWNAA